jgi:hypothetical protein
MAASDTVLSAYATAVQLLGSADVACVFAGDAAHMHAAPYVSAAPCSSKQ